MVVGGGNNDKLKSKGGLTVDKTTTTAHVSSNNYFHHLWAKILRQQKKKRKGLWEAHFRLLTNVMHSVFCVRSICIWQQIPKSTHPHLSMHCGHSVSVLCALGLVAIWFAFAHTHNQETPSTWPTWWAFSVKVGYGCLLVFMSLPMFLVRYFSASCHVEPVDQKALHSLWMAANQPSFLGHATKIKNLFELLRKHKVIIYVSRNHSTHNIGIRASISVDVDHCI